MSEDDVYNVLSSLNQSKAIGIDEKSKNPEILFSFSTYTVPPSVFICVFHNTDCLWSGKSIQ